MIVRGIDVDGDWQFGKGKSDYQRDNEAVAQSIATRLRCFLGDCYFDLEAGIDWFNLLGSKNIQGIVLSVKSCILNAPNVTGVLDVSAKVDENRKQTLKYKAASAFSAVPIEDSVGVP